MSQRPSRLATHRRRGFFLVLVLVVIAIATMGVSTFTQTMVVHDKAAFLAVDQVVARSAGESAIEALRLILSQPKQSRSERGNLFNNAALFQAVPVGGLEGASARSSYTIIATGLRDDATLGGIRFGLQDESARLNVNVLTVLEGDAAAAAAGEVGIDDLASIDGSAGDESTSTAQSLLMSLPGMTTDIAAAILDWLDTDDDPRTGGAEADYYATLPAPYEPTNGPIDDVEDLLLVRGVTAKLLFGADANRNGVIDADEQNRYGVTIDTPGALGWAAYLTTRSLEASTTAEANPRVNLNQTDLEKLDEELAETSLGELYTSYILAYRQYGQNNAAVDPASIAASASGPANADLDFDAADGGQGAAGGADVPSAGMWTADQFESLDLSAGAGVELRQVLDLFDSWVVIGEGDDAVRYESPFVSDPVAMEIFMVDLMDNVTVSDSPVMPGRININEAPVEILAGIPGMDEATLRAIIENRDASSDAPIRRFGVWPLAEGFVGIDQMRTLTPLVCGGGDVYRAQIVGFLNDSGIAHRSQVIIDATTPFPRIKSMQNLTHLGRGFNRSVLGNRGVPTR